MTILASWVRTSKQGMEELIMISDSRLNGYGKIDYAPKIFQMPRSDVIIGFAGSTIFAYPFLLQVINSVSTFYPFLTRAVDYKPFSSWVLNIINDIFSKFHPPTPIKELEDPEVEFIIGGYSWSHKEFFIDKIFYVNSIKKFEKKSARNYSMGKMEVIGDSDLKKEFSLQLKDLISNKYKGNIFNSNDKIISKFDFEPFEVVRGMLLSKKFDTIGGPPQILKVSQFMQSNYVAVYWPNKESGNIYVCGRPVFPFEKLDTWILDPILLSKSHLFLEKTIKSKRKK
jgi:hypothetical protein